MKNELIKIKTFKLPETHPDSLTVPFRLMVVGASGTGKTNATCNYLKNYYPDHKIFNHKILISPTGTVNKAGLRSEPKFDGFADEEHQTFNKMTMNKIFEDQLQRIIKHKEYLDDSKLYDKLINEGIEALTQKELLHLFEKYSIEKPTPPYGKETYPHLLILFDDNASLTESKFLSDMASTARHYFCSLVFLSQHYSQLSRGLRKQMNALMLFKTGDEKLLKTLWEQCCSGDLKRDQYLNFFKELENRWDFIFNRWDISDTKKRYTKNFGESLNWKDP